MLLARRRLVTSFVFPSLVLLAACADGATEPSARDIRIASPLPDYAVLQGFVWNAGRQGYHLANDLVALAGDTVYAAADGRVFFAETGVEGYGGIVLVEHRPADGERFVTLYGHLSARRGLLVAVGDSVIEGEALATAADDDEDGGQWEPHLHFGVRPGAANLDAEVCGLWLYVGYSRTCAGWSHERFRDQWVDPGLVIEPERVPFAR